MIKVLLLVCACDPCVSMQCSAGNCCVIKAQAYTEETNAAAEATRQSRTWSKFTHTKVDHSSYEPPQPYTAFSQTHDLCRFGQVFDTSWDDKFLSGLNCLDTSRGITLIVQKLPYFMHVMWFSLASWYNESYWMSYPPFSFFAKFVGDQAKTLNDLSFAALTDVWGSGKAEHPSRYIKVDNV